MVLGVLVAFVVLGSQVGYYQFQERIQSAVEVEDVDSENDPSQKSPTYIIKIDPVTSGGAAESIFNYPLQVIGDTYIDVREKVDIWNVNTGNPINYFMVLIHCIIPINAP